MIRPLRLNTGKLYIDVVMKGSFGTIYGVFSAPGKFDPHTSGKDRAAVEAHLRRLQGQSVPVAPPAQIAAPPATAPQAVPRPPALSTPTTTARPANVYSRREQIHNEATARKWKVAFRGNVDNVGPFALTHDPQKTSVYLSYPEAEYFVVNLVNPTGKEVVDTLRDVRDALKAKAEAMMPVILDRMRLPENRNKTMTWTNSILPWVRQSPESVGTNPFLLGVYLLATLKRKGLIVTSPPSLADQPAAVSVPDLDVAANMFRVYRVDLVSRDAVTAPTVRTTDNTPWPSTGWDDSELVAAAPVKPSPPCCSAYTPYPNRFTELTGHHRDCPSFPAAKRQAIEEQIDRENAEQDKAQEIGAARSSVSMLESLVGLNRRRLAVPRGGANVRDYNATMAIFQRELDGDLISLEKAKAKLAALLSS